MKKLTFIIILLFTSTSYAEYCAVGKIEGNICTGFVIETCKHIQVDAVKNDDGKLFALNRCYPSVSQYNEGKDSSLCWMQTKSTGGGALNWAKNTINQPNFVHKNKSGKYEEIDVEYLVFKCIKH